MARKKVYIGRSEMHGYELGTNYRSFSKKTGFPLPYFIVNIQEAADIWKPGLAIGEVWAVEIGLMHQARKGDAKD